MAASNPVKLVPMLWEPKGCTGYLTDEEVGKILDELPDHIKLLVECALFTGVRTGELLNLRRDDVNFDTAMITVSESKNDEVRFISMATRLQGVVLSLDRQGEYVFGFGGHQMRSFRTGFDAAVRRAEIADFRFHDLRHTFASKLVQAGVDLLTVKELMGHKTLAMTIR